MQFADLLSAEALTFDDLLLVPGYAEVLPTQIDLRTPCTKHSSSTSPCFRRPWIPNDVRYAMTI